MRRPGLWPQPVLSLCLYGMAQVGPGNISSSFHGHSHSSLSGCPVCRKNTKEVLSPLKDDPIFKSGGGWGGNNNKTKSKEEKKKAQMLPDVHNIQQSGWQTASGSGPASWTSPCSRAVEASVVLSVHRVLSGGTTRDTSFLTCQVFHFLLNMF